MSDTQAKLDAALAENAVLREALSRIHEGACRTAQDSRSRDDDRYCIGAVIDMSGRALVQPNPEAELIARKARALDALAEEVLRFGPVVLWTNSGGGQFPAIVHRGLAWCEGFRTFLEAVEQGTAQQNGGAR
jgi:hypothetical protein